MLLAALLGFLAGVGLNLLADDLPARTANAADRFSRPLRLPACDYCGRTFTLWQWSGLASFLLRGGRCRHCGAPRPLRHPLVELALALSFAFLWRAEPALDRLFPSALVLSILVLITVIDIEHRLILHLVSIPAALLMLLAGGFTTGHGWPRTLIGGAVGFGVVALIYLLGLGFSWLAARLRGKPLDEVAFGWGDVMLGGVVGLLTGWSGVALALVIAILSAGAVGAIVLVVQIARGRYRIFDAIPYGPFLVLGALVVYFGSGPLKEWLSALLTR